MAAASILPTLNLHWLPAVLANPNMTINPAHIAAIAGKATSEQVVIGPTPGGAASVSTAPNLTPGIVPNQASLTMPTLGATNLSIPTLSTSAVTIPQSNIYNLFPKETPHFESEVPGGAEKEGDAAGKAIRSSTAATLLPAVRIPTTGVLSPSVAPNGVIPTGVISNGVVATVPNGIQPGFSSSTIGVATVVAAEKIREIEEDDPNHYVKEVEEIISPKGIIFNITIHTVILSAFVFIAILAWFETLRTWYDETFDPVLGLRNVNQILIRFWYSVFVTALVIILVYILHRWSKSAR